MKRLLLIPAVALSLFAISCAPASAMNCRPYEEVRASLSDKHSEDIVWIGIAQDETQLVIFGTASGSDFTVLGVTGETACVIGYGKSWAAITPLTPDLGEDG